MFYEIVLKCCSRTSNSISTLTQPLPWWIFCTHTSKVTVLLRCEITHRNLNSKTRTSPNFCNSISVTNNSIYSLQCTISFNATTGSLWSFRMGHRRLIPSNFTGFNGNYNTHTDTTRQLHWIINVPNMPRNNGNPFVTVFVSRNTLLPRPNSCISRIRNKKNPSSDSRKGNQSRIWNLANYKRKTF